MNTLRRRLPGLAGISLPAAVLVAVLALAMAGGGAYAAKKITGKTIKNNTVSTKDITDASLTGVDVADGSIAGLDISDNSVTSTDILNNTIASIDVADGSLTGADVQDDSLQSADVAPLDGDLDIIDNSITSHDIATNAVGSEEVLDFGLSNEDVGVLYAEVNGDGTLVSSSGGVTSSRILDGQYHVDFGRSIVSCAKFGTLGDSSDSSSPGEISAVDRSSDDNAAYVATYSSAGAASDRDFKLLVVC